VPEVFWFNVGNVQLVKVPLDGVPSAPPLTRFPLAVPVKAAVIVPAVKLPDASLATIVDAVFALVAFDVTVNVAPVAWFAVNVCEPDNPVPATLIVRVALLTVGTSDVSAIVPVVAGIVIVVVPAAAAALNTVVPEVEPLNVAPPPPIVGVVSDGVLANTKAPVPVSSVTAAARLAELGVARKVATFEPKPLTPVEIGKPVAFVRVAETGVPKAVAFPEASRLTDLLEG
jgi:hypothetical protein